MASILFVCTANRFRSPIAALYFAREVVRHGDDDRVTVSSAGTWGVSGMPAMPKAVQLAKQYDLNLSYHRSQVVSEDILSNADLILVMASGHKEAITHEFPATRGRVFLLTEAVGKQPVDILDPYGEAHAPPEHVIKDIIDLIDGGYRQLIILALKIKSKRTQ